MTIASIVVRSGVVVALFAATACGSQGEDGGEAFPSRDWSGSYALEAVESSTDCVGADAPPPLGETVLDVRQSLDNNATVRIGPMIAMGGRFDGDELEASGSITQPIPLPDSLAARASAEDSLETIGYALEASFAEDETLTGRYVIRAPDLNALFGGSGAGRCEYVYEVRGMPLIGGLGETGGADERP
ncbi:MAG: hypothetical protein ACREK2_07575 [Gemmatimonadota bacterium]